MRQRIAVLLLALALPLGLAQPPALAAGAAGQLRSVQSASEISPQGAQTDEVRTFSLGECLDYAVANNETLQKDKLSMEAAVQSKREVVGAMLPQLSASGGFTNNIQKTAIAMPNFVNSMMPEAMRDPNAPKYMTVTMGMDYTANWGASLSQQILNFSIFNAIEIAKMSGDMTQLGAEMDENDVIAQTATLFYTIQVLEYALGEFDESISLMDRTVQMLEVNLDNGLMRPVDVKQVLVTKTNLETEKLAIVQALEVQKNLLKLQMGFPMGDGIAVEPIDLDAMEKTVYAGTLNRFDVTEQLPFQMFNRQRRMLELQRKSAVAEVLPALTLSANYSMNYMGDDFKGETYHHFPVSMISLNLRMPIFTGMSKTAKIKKAGIELKKAEFDEKVLTQSLSMAYNNAQMQLEQSRRTIESQRRNKEMAQEVFDVMESNYREGISSLSDLLNADSSLIKSQMNYVDALNNCMKAYIDLKKADGTIKELKNN